MVGVARRSHQTHLEHRLDIADSLQSIIRRRSCLVDSGDLAQASLYRVLEVLDVKRCEEGGARHPGDCRSTTDRIAGAPNVLF